MAALLAEATKDDLDNIGDECAALAEEIIVKLCMPPGST
jgi:hypothetical protein